ncbi:MAG TPA: hypothetical protein VD838_13255, partial [Anaeromyxobacteraceae bacterium]|nr:hypothetical protein [Anaeromyxobacteraceae bacterium]
PEESLELALDPAPGSTRSEAPRAGAALAGDGGPAAALADDPLRAIARDAAPALPPLREVVRALPPAIDAARVREGQPLELAFGAALKVDLRIGRDGVELTLRPDARLTRAAEAELPGLVQALAARGVRLARARVGPPLGRNDPAEQVAR